MASALHVAEARHLTRRWPTKLARFGVPKEVKLVRLTDLHPEEGVRLGKIADDLPRIEPGAWVTPKPLASAKVALITTSGIHRRSDAPFKPGIPEYRLLPKDVDFGDLVMSHLSVNFDRTAYQEDPNVMMPLERLHELQADGVVGEVADWHYSFMGAIPSPLLLEESGTEVGELLRRDGVDAAVLIPV